MATPLHEAVQRVGDRWTLLLIDALLDGPRRFNELQEAVPGIAPNILSRRLKHLEAEALVRAVPYSRRPLRVTYELSAGGRDLAGTLRLLAEWGASHGEAEPLRHNACGTPAESRWYCPTCARLLDDEETSDLRWL
jgi:DNA-binding HxlR family transcriptional regulator